MKSVVLIGGGGHCASVIDVIESLGDLRIHGILDRRDLVGKELSGYGILSTDDDIEDLMRQGHGFVITVGHMGNAQTRIKLFEKLRDLSAWLPALQSARAIVSRHSTVGDGTVVMHGAVVNAGSKVMENCIINTSAVVEHDCQIGPHTHISTQASVNGGCTIGARCLVGSGAVIRQGIRVSDDTIVGAGAVVVKSIVEPGTTVAGVPSRRIR